MAILDDNHAIALRLAELQGRRPNGRLWERHADGRYAEVKGHDCGSAWCLSTCSRCGWTREEVLDGLAPKQCTGRRPVGGPCQHCRTDSVVMVWEHQSGRRYYRCFGTCGQRWATDADGRSEGRGGHHLRVGHCDCPRCAQPIPAVESFYPRTAELPACDCDFCRTACTCWFCSHMRTMRYHGAQPACTHW